MPNPKHMDSYPTKFLELLTFCLENPDKEVPVRCTNRREALSLRSQIGGFVSAYEKEFPEGPGKLNLRTVGTYLSHNRPGEPVDLVFRHRDSHEVVDKLDEAMKNARPIGAIKR